MRTPKQLIKAMERHVEKLTKLRDELRDIESEASEHAELSSEASEHLRIAIDALSEQF